MASRATAPRALIAIAALGGACDWVRGDVEALALIDVIVDRDVADHDTLKLSAAGSARSIAGGRREFRVGYYLAPGAAVVLAGDALAGTCVVGHGTLSVPALRAGGRTEVGTLRILRSTEPCVDASGPPLTVALPFANGAKDVARAEPLRLTFSAALAPASLAALVLRDGAAVIETDAALDAGGTVVTLTPRARLPMLAALTLTVGAGVRARDGRRLHAEVIASFTTADGQWSAPVELQRADGPTIPDFYAGAIGLGVAPSKRVIVAWERVRSLIPTRRYAAAVHASRYLPDSGTWSEAQEVVVSPFGPLMQLSAAIDAQGAALVVYDVWPEDQHQFPSAFARRMNVTGYWQPEVLLDGGPGISGDHPRVAMGDKGDAIAAWHRFHLAGEHERVVASRYGASGWSTPELIDEPTSEPVDARAGTAVAVDPAGNGFVAWSNRRLTAGIGAVWANRYTAARGWGRAVNLSGAITGVTASNQHGVPQLAVDARGNALCVFNQSNGGAMLALAAAYDAVTDRWSPAVELAPDEATGPRVAMNAAGSAIAVWRSGVVAIGARRFAGAWASPRVTMPEASHGVDLAVGLDGRGHALIAWRALRPGATGPRVFVARETAVDGIGPPVALGSRRVDFPPRLAVLPDGTALAVWIEGDGPYHLMAAWRE